MKDIEFRNVKFILLLINKFGGTINMTSKERLQMAMDHKEPDRVPYMATFVPEVTLVLKEKYKKELASIGKDIELPIVR